MTKSNMTKITINKGFPRYDELAGKITGNKPFDPSKYEDSRQTANFKTEYPVEISKGDSEGEGMAVFGNYNDRPVMYAGEYISPTKDKEYTFGRNEEGNLEYSSIKPNGDVNVRDTGKEASRFISRGLDTYVKREGNDNYTVARLGKNPTQVKICSKPPVCFEL